MKKNLLIIFAFCSLFQVSHAKIAVSAKAGTVYDGTDWDYSYLVTLYHKIDEQVLLGVSSGQRGDKIPLLFSGYIRLPIGKIILPVAIGDIGTTLEKNTKFYWRAGGGFDWKNGKHTSILILGGYERFGRDPALYGKLGLLLEF